MVLAVSKQAAEVPATHGKNVLMANLKLFNLPDHRDGMVSKCMTEALRSAYPGFLTGFEVWGRLPQTIFLYALRLMLKPLCQDLERMEVHVGGLSDGNRIAYFERITKFVALDWTGLTKTSN